MATGFQPAETFISFGQPASPSSKDNEASSSARKGKRKASDTPAPGEKQTKKKKKDKKKKGNKKSQPVEQPDKKDGLPGLSKKQKKALKEQEHKARNSDRKRGNNRGIEAGPRNKKEEEKAAERHAPWTELVDVDLCRDPVDLLTEEINAFYKYVSPTREEFEVRLFMIELITRTINKLWPEAEVTPFGSWQTQLYLPQGDIDLVVAHKYLSDANKQRLLAELGKAMRQANITDVVAIIARARVPIIKFVTLEGKINVDISLNQGNGVTAGKIINQYLDALPGARQLILIVKYFLSQRSMNEVYTGGLGSYSVICMVISFLQLHPKLRRSEINPELNLGTLLIEFFELFGRNFNYNDVGISIRRGGFYFSKASRGWMKGQSFLLSIEDPQDKDNDISGGSFGIRQVRNTLGGAYELLGMRLFERAEEMSRNARGGRRSTSWKDKDGDDWSILGGVMGITKETLKQRNELTRIHLQGRLHHKLSIPLGADPKPYVQNYRPPPVISVPSVNEHGRGASSPAPPAESSRRNKKDVGAIMVEDDELGSDDDDSDSDTSSYSSSDSDDSDSDPVAISPPTIKSRSASHLAQEDISDTDSDEIIEIPQLFEPLRRGKRPLGDSEPSEDEIEVLSNPPEESRYAGGKGKGKTKVKDAFRPPTSPLSGQERQLSDSSRPPTPPLPHGEEEEEKDEIDSDEEALRRILAESDGDLGSEDEIGKEWEGAIQVDSDSDEEEKKGRKKRKRGIRSEERRTFWAAKGGNRLGQGSGDISD
ncbi:DNA polymerase sigma subunit [Cryptococcus deuterogattii LA55]|nr:DNA polymerase sigma subunit [Cryptococcus deuterogattii LA55]KIR92850.1 DNA polymerase sigma subunit [Cryptococcus deuterogattii CBS 10090]